MGRQVGQRLCAGERGGAQEPLPARCSAHAAGACVLPQAPQPACTCPSPAAVCIVPAPLQATKTALQPLTSAVGPPLVLVGQALRGVGGQAWRALAGAPPSEPAASPLPATACRRALRKWCHMGPACAPALLHTRCAARAPLACLPAAVGVTLVAVLQAGLAPVAAVLLGMWTTVGAAFLPLFQAVQHVAAGPLLWVGQSTAALWAGVRGAGAALAAGGAAAAGTAKAGRAMGAATSQVVAEQVRAASSGGLIGVWWEGGSLCVRRWAERSPAAVRSTSAGARALR